jgi:uncharacterized protein DUF2569
LTLYFAATLPMERPNGKQFLVLWSGVAWTLASLVVAGDYLARALIGGLVVTAALFWQLSGKTHKRIPGVAPPDVPPDLKPESIPAKTDLTISVAATPQQTAGPSGMGGWLVFVLLGPLLTPILTVYVVSQYADIWNDLWFFTLAIAGGFLAGWSLYVALALLNRWPSAPKLARAQLMISWFSWTSLGILAAITTGVDYSKALVPPGFVGSLFGTVVWVSYLEKSRRVQATYGPLPVGPVKSGRARAVAFAVGMLVCFIAIGIADFQRQSWVEFSADDGGYTVSAPGLAKKSTLTNGEIEEVFGNDVRGFFISRIALSAESAENGHADAQAYLDGVRDAVLANVKGSIITSQSVSLAGCPGIEFAASFPSNGARGDLRARVYKTSSEGFLLLVTGPQGGRTASEAEKFFQSFRIKH